MNGEKGQSTGDNTMMNMLYVFIVTAIFRECKKIRTTK
jgi:hypothetical protein